MITRNNFFAFAHANGEVNYPDSIELFTNVDVYAHSDFNTYIVGNYTGSNLVPQDISFDDYFDAVHRPELEANIRIKIKAKQIETLDALEGNNGSLQRKAIEEITTLSSYDRYDALMAEKQYVRTYGNEQEELLPAMTPEELMEYEFVIDLTQAGPLKSRRLTIGAFEGRFSAEEQTRLHEARVASAELNRYYNAMISRTHVWLDYPAVVEAMNALHATGLLDKEPADTDVYANRMEEIMRDGDSTEIYRVISYV